MKYRSILFFVLLFPSVSLLGQEFSVAREWNEVLLESIRGDFARPTVHARNLFHLSAAMYDAWTAYGDEEQPYLLGQELHGYICGFNGVPVPQNIREAREEAISYAAYRLILHRFQHSPNPSYQKLLAKLLMKRLGYDTTYTSVDYTRGRPAALGNYIAQQYIAYGKQDGSNEDSLYANKYYQPLNQAFNPETDRNANLADPNHWQPLAFDNFIGQSGFNEGNIPTFLSPEWGQVHAFALNDSDLTVYKRDGFDYYVYHDPGPPPQLTNVSEWDDYRKGFMQVLFWSAHLDPTDGILWDISPGAFGNMEDLPETREEIEKFYDVSDGPPGEGHPLNPHTGQPYPSQVVPRGDFTRVLAEFWADGPDSETPPGHWFTILNYVSDHPLLEKKFMGQGEELEDLEWDVKAYFVMGGAMHDAAVSAWGIKGWYDYIRPVSAIRYLGEFQQEDPTAFDYRPYGLQARPGMIERITENDSSLQEWFSINPNINWNSFIGEWKVNAWRSFKLRGAAGPNTAGSGWVPIRVWFPYQRLSFITPPFAGYVSGHSTYSRAAAEVLTMLTGDKYFPGGLGEFDIQQKNFLVFEEGPTLPFKLQWATYYDAADQSGLSRIWGGIHPPADDIPGRIIGEEVGKDAFEFALEYFNGGWKNPLPPIEAGLFPNPVSQGSFVNAWIEKEDQISLIQLVDLGGTLVEEFAPPAPFGEDRLIQIPTDKLGKGIYLVRLLGKNSSTAKLLVE